MVKWGIIGAGNIARKFAKTIESVEGAELYAISNRSLEKAQKFKEEFPCEKAYGSYQEIVDDENIDAVYVSVPHSYHFEWSMKVLKAGKAVLCEKPATLNHAEISQIVAYARKNNVFYMEAMKGRFTPAYKKMKQMLEEVAIGKVESVYTSLCRVFPIIDDSRLYQPEEGGCLLDMGVYNVGFAEDFISSPYVLESVDYESYKNRVEVYVNAKLKAGDVDVTIESAFDRDIESKAIIKGTSGQIIAEDFHRLTKFTLENANGKESFDIPCIVNDFYGQIKHVTECVRDGVTQSPYMTFEDSEKVAKIIEIIKSEINLPAGNYE